MHNDKFLPIVIGKSSKTEFMIGNPIHKLNLPKGCLVALLRRDIETIIPNGNTIVEKNDKLTIIGDPANINKLRQDLFDEPEKLDD